MAKGGNYKSIRREFKFVAEDCPVLQKQVYGKPLTYLDNAAMTQMPRQVVEAMVNFYYNFNANVHRGIHRLSEEATDAYENARANIAKFIGARPETVIFTRNSTESINLVAYSWGRTNLREGDEVLLSIMEHHSNLVPWQQIAKEKGAKLVYVYLNEDGTLDLRQYKEALESGRVRIVAITHMSNVLGTVVPLEVVIRMAHNAGAIVLADGAQGVAHFGVDVTQLDVDFYVFSGYKMLGPTGIGVLYGKRELLEEMPPFNFGGSMINHVGLYESAWAELPQKFEGGTPNIGGAIGLSAAVDYLLKLTIRRLREREKELLVYAMNRLAEIPGLKIYGPPAEMRGGIVSFVMDGIHPHDLASILDQEGVAIRAGHHCAEPLHTYLRIPATARASFCIYNQEYDVDALVSALLTARKVFGYVTA